LIHASLQDYDVRKQPPVAVNRTTQVFVNLNNSNWRLDKNIFVPFGLVIGEDGMKTFDNLFSGYGQEPDQVHNVPMQCMTGQLDPPQHLIYSRGFAYLSSNFPLLSYTNAGTEINNVLGHRVTHRSGCQALGALAKSKGMLSKIRHHQLQHDSSTMRAVAATRCILCIFACWAR